MKKFQLGKAIFTMSVVAAMTPAVVFADDTVVNPPPKPQPVTAPQTVPGTITNATPGSTPKNTVPAKPKKRPNKQKPAPVPAPSNSSNQLKDVPDPMDLNSD